MVQFILFLDRIRQDEIDIFYKACQMYRDYYRGYETAHHPLTYFQARTVLHSAVDMSTTYTSYPQKHIKYKLPAVLPATTDRTSEFPPLPDRTLAGRYNKTACFAFTR